jgi:hypothetical protein
MGKFIVHDNLPDYLAQGMFKKPGSYDVIMRYSSLTPKIVPDNDLGRGQEDARLDVQQLPDPGTAGPQDDVRDCRLA